MATTDPTPEELLSWPRRISSFLAIYLACAILFQTAGATPEWGPQSLPEALSAGLFGMLGLMALVHATRRRGVRRLFWIGSFFALVALGLDEFFELHESLAIGSIGAADHLKVGLWVGAAGGLAIVHWLERPSRGAQLAMALGYVMHTLYLVAEIGDGGYFQLPLSPAVIMMVENGFELSMLSMYLFAFAAIGSEERIAEFYAAHEDPEQPSRAA